MWASDSRKTITAIPDLTKRYLETANAHDGWQKQLPQNRDYLLTSLQPMLAMSVEKVFRMQHSKTPWH